MRVEDLWTPNRWVDALTGKEGGGLSRFNPVSVVIRRINHRSIIFRSLIVNAKVYDETIGIRFY